MEGNWVEKFFIEKGELFLRILNAHWERAEREVEYIIKLLEKYGINQESEILEVGCGNGRILINLAKKGFKNLHGIDISPIYIEDAKKKMREHGVSNIDFKVGDARKLDELYPAKKFDALLSIWSTVLGYYQSPQQDIEILKKYRHVVKDEGYLFILSTANRDFTTLLQSLGCSGAFYIDYGDFSVIEQPQFKHEDSTLNSKWIFYRKKENGDLEYIDEAEVRLRLYSIHEVVSLAKEAGWTYVDAYRSIATQEPFRPSISSLNIIFKAT